MNKKSIVHSALGIACLLMLALTALSLTACFSDWQSDEGTITISFGQGAGDSARAAAYPPTGEMLSQIKYKITLSGKSTFHFEANGGQTIKCTVPIGRYNIKVDAYYQNKLYATGSKDNVEVKAGTNKTVTIQMAKAFDPDAPYYTIIFNSNGGSGTMANMACNIGETYLLPDNKFTRAGYIFAGWSTSATGNIEFQDGASVTDLSATDGDTVTLYAQWTQNNTPASGLTNWTEITGIDDPVDTWFYGNGMFVAIYDKMIGTLISYCSADGITWESNNNSVYVSSNMMSFAYGNGVFMRTNCSPSIMTTIVYSKDGLNWEESTANVGGSSNYTGLVFTNGKFAAYDYQHQTMITSEDGNDWEEKPCTTPFPFNSGITYGNGKFVARDGNSIATSTDGITYTEAVSPSQSGERIQSLNFGNGIFVALGYKLASGEISGSGRGSAVIACSTDGESWTREVIDDIYIENFSSSGPVMAYGGGKFVMMWEFCDSNGEYTDIGNIATSTDGVTWTPVEYSGLPFTRLYAFGAGRFIAQKYKDDVSYEKVFVYSGNVE